MYLRNTIFVISLQVSLLLFNTINSGHSRDLDPPAVRQYWLQILHPPRHQNCILHLYLRFQLVLAPYLLHLKMLCPLCLSFARTHLATTTLAATHTPLHTSQHRSLTTTPVTPTPPEIADAENTEKQNPGPFYHYSHYRELESSAKAGCELCSLIVNSMPSKLQQNQRQSARQKDKPVQFWLIETPRRTKRDDRGIKLRFRVNIATETNMDKFRLHLELYERSGMIESLF
jgi:hypothetical protein